MIKTCYLLKEKLGLDYFIWLQETANNAQSQRVKG